MTLVLDFRTAGVAGHVKDPELFDVDPLADPLSYRSVPRWEWDNLVHGRNVLFGTHGFNVDREAGVRSLAGFGARLGLGAGDLYIAVVWPGDWWLPAINYPFEGETAMDCGRRLAAWCGNRVGDASSISFVSHSLGARLILEAIGAMRKPVKPSVRLVCLMAGAINNDCLEREYVSTAVSADTIKVLASRADLVLQLAYPAGDWVANALHPDHPQSSAALGRTGPVRPIAGKLSQPWQVTDPGFGHGSYLPHDAAAPAPGVAWLKAAAFVERAWNRQSETWPV